MTFDPVARLNAKNAITLANEALAQAQVAQNLALQAGPGDTMELVATVAGQQVVTIPRTGLAPRVYVNGLRQSARNYSIQGAQLTINTGAQVSAGDTIIIDFLQEG